MGAEQSQAPREAGPGLPGADKQASGSPSPGKGMAPQLEADSEQEAGAGAMLGDFNLVRFAQPGRFQTRDCRGRLRASLLLAEWPPLWELLPSGAAVTDCCALAVRDQASTLINAAEDLTGLDIDGDGQVHNMRLLNANETRFLQTLGHSGCDLATL